MSLIQQTVCDALDTLFVYTARQNLGPTRCTRFFYLWFHAITSSYNWIQPAASTATSQDIIDNWNWSTPRHLLWQPRTIAIWITCVLTAVNPLFDPTYDSSDLLANERKAYKWSVAQQQAAHFRVKQLGRWRLWYANWSAWYTQRQNDGSTEAMLRPASLPNGDAVLDVAGTVDPNTLSNPDKWTPLKIAVKPSAQTYLTYNWSDVKSVRLTSEQEDMLVASAAAHFPTTAQRQTEIAEVVSITGSLNDDQKSQAEFWAGGPGTLSPPGMFLWFWKTYVSMTPSPVSLDTFFFSGLDVATHLFETGRVVWGLKRKYMESRPIQDVRRWYRDSKLVGYDGSEIDGSLWVPYQESNFVTPPFADFPSGHSAFSQSFALVMTRWFGPEIPKTPTKTHGDMKLLCPMLETQTQPFGSIVVRAGASYIQSGSVPAADKTLGWTSWQDMADSAGLSRKYGGIHASSAHTGSQAVAAALHAFLTPLRPLSP